MAIHRRSDSSGLFPCKTCGCFVTPGTDKCPNCENSPYVPPATYSAAEFKGSHPLSAIKQKLHAAPA